MATPASRRQGAQRAFAALLEGLGATARGEMAATPRRAAALWADHLLAGEGQDLRQLLGRGLARRQVTPVCVNHIGVHLVCPHHLTVAFGTAHLGYVPGGRVVGFGALSALARACTARLVLQEDAVGAMAQALCEHLGARAAAAMVDAEHPCHNVLQARAHRARAVTWAHAGDAALARRLEVQLARGAGAAAPRRRR